MRFTGMGTSEGLRGYSDIGNMAGVDLVPVSGLCPICGELVQDRGHFWEGHVLIERDDRAPLVAHPGHLHPDVIVVTEPFEGKTSENLEVGRLAGAPDGNGGWWLVLNPIVVSKQNAIRAYEVSIPWERVRRIELR